MQTNVFSLVSPPHLCIWICTINTASPCMHTYQPLSMVHVRIVASTECTGLVWWNGGSRVEVRMLLCEKNKERKSLSFFLFVHTITEYVHAHTRDSLPSVCTLYPQYCYQCSTRHCGVKGGRRGERSEKKKPNKKKSLIGYLCALCYYHGSGGGGTPSH